MKRCRRKAGMTLLEMLVSLLILTLLVTAMGTVMDTAMGIYGDSLFESNSASLAGIVNTVLGDVLRYAENIREPEEADAAGNPVDEGIGFVFTNVSYGVRDVYFQTKTGDDRSKGILTLRSLHTDADGTIQETELVNTGAYPDLEITNFQAIYVVPGAEGKRGGYFYITYTVQSTVNTEKYREVETIVRLLNA